MADAADAGRRAIRSRLRVASRRRVLRRDLLRCLGPLGSAALGATYVQPLAASSTSHATTTQEGPRRQASRLLTQIPAGPEPGLRWRRDLPPPFGPVLGPVLIGDTLLIIGESGLATLAAETGAVRWAHELQRTPLAGCACLASAGAGEDVAYAVTEGNQVLALDMATGRRRWASRVGALAVSRPIAGDGQVYLAVAETPATETAAPRFALVALAAEAGEVVWQASLPERPLPELLLAGETIYGLNLESAAFAIEAAGGTVKWLARFPAGPESLLPARFGQKVLVVRGIDGLYGLDPATGAVRWRRPDLPSLSALPPLAADEAVYAGHRNGLVGAVVGESGAWQWQYLTGAPLVGELQMARSHLYAATATGQLMAFDAATGEVEWQVAAGGPPLIWAILDDDLYVEVGGKPGGLLALDTASGELVARWLATGTLLGPPVRDATALYVATAAAGSRGVTALVPAAPG